MATLVSIPVIGAIVLLVLLCVAVGLAFKWRELENIVRDWDSETLLRLDGAAEVRKKSISLSDAERAALSCALEYAALGAGGAAWVHDLVVAFERNGLELGPQALGIVGVRAERALLNVFTDDHEWVIARDAADAVAVYEAHIGDKCSDPERFVSLPPDKVMGIWCDEHGDPGEIGEGTLVKRTALEWCKRRGRGYLCTIEQ